MLSGILPPENPSPSDPGIFNKGVRNIPDREDGVEHDRKYTAMESEKSQEKCIVAPS